MKNNDFGFKELLLSKIFCRHCLYFILSDFIIAYLKPSVGNHNVLSFGFYHLLCPNNNEQTI